jgi:Zn-dependent peptidase ImmA (M78 family)
MTAEHAKITASVAWLYSAARVRPPSADACIAPLRGFLAGLFLDCVELPLLTVRAVADYLSQYNISVALSGDGDRAKLAGYLHVSMSVGFIFVNQPDRVTRRRFSVAHELGHYVLHLRPVLEEFKRRDEPLTISVTDAPRPGPTNSDSESEQGFRGHISTSDDSVVSRLLPPADQMEEEADKFASNLLMPSEVVRELAAQSGLRGDDLVWKLATEMLVSRSSMERRLTDLQLI